MKKKRSIKTFNALKGIASIGILFSHMAYLGMAENGFWRSFYNVFMSKGAVCTTFFVVCSGYFLNYSWSSKRNFVEYIVSKLKRVYPLTFLVFIAALLVDIVFAGSSFAKEVPVATKQWFFNIFANVFLFKAFIPIEATYYSFHGPSWYISVLFVMYLVSYPFLRGLHDTEEAKRKKWLKLIKGIVAITYIIQLVICLTLNAKGVFNLWLSYVNPIFRIFGEGFAGIILCECIEKREYMIKHSDAVEWFAVFVFIGSFMVRYIDRNLTIAWIQIFPMAFIIWVFRYGRGCISRILEMNALQFLGSISYELYMTHAFVYEGIPIFVRAISTNAGDWIVTHAGTRFAITFVLCIVTAWITHCVMQWINKKIVRQ